MAILPLRLGRFVSWMMRHRDGVAWSVMLFPLFFVSLMIIGKLLAPYTYRFFISENNVVELATLLVYLLACGIAASLALDLWRQNYPIYSMMYFILSAGLFVVSMEEISWGQHFIKNTSPSFFETYNRQGETNFHNIDAFPLHNAFILVGLYGAFSRMLLPSAFKRRHPSFVDLLTPRHYLFLFFFITFALYIYYQYLYYTHLLPLGLLWEEYFTPEHFIGGKDQEPIELLLGLGFLLFVAANKLQYRRAGPAPAFELRRAA